MRARTLRRQLERASRGKGKLASKGESKATVFMLGAFLFLATAVVYAPTSHHEFLNYDDDDYVLNNAHVNEGLHWEVVRWALTSNEQANWHPVTWLSHSLDSEFFGMDAGWHHLTNVVLHACNVLLLFLVLRCATRASFHSFLVASLFAVHPFNVGTVAWVAERKSLLCMLFSLLAIGAYVRFCGKRGWKPFAAMLGFFILALASKPMAVTLPVLLFLMDYWPLRRIAGWTEPSPSGPDQTSVARLLWEKVPLLLASALSCVVTLWAQKAGGALRPLQIYSLDARFKNALYSYVVYVEKTFWPAGFSVYYPHPGTSIATWKAVAAGTFLVAITAIALIFRKKKPQVLFGWSWFVFTLVPVIGIIQVGDQGMADRYAYLPLIGLFILLVWSASAVLDAKNIGKAPRWAVAFAVLGAVTVITEGQLAFWQDSVSLWSHSFQVTSGNLQVEKQLANAMVREGDTKEALPHLVHITLVDPTDVTTALNLGSYYASQGNVEQAQLAFQNVLRTTDGHSLSVYDRRVRASAFLNLGLAEILGGDFELGLKSFRQAADLEPTVVDEVIDNLRGSFAHASSPSTGLRLSLLLRARDQNAAASVALDEALRLDPGLVANKALSAYINKYP